MRARVSLRMSKNGEVEERKWWERRAKSVYVYGGEGGGAAGILILRHLFITTRVCLFLYSQPQAESSTGATG